MVVEKSLYARIVAMYSSLLVIIGAEMWYLEEDVKHRLDPRRSPFPEVFCKLDYM